MTYEQALAINQNLTPEQVKNDLERFFLRGETPIIKGVAMAMQALEKQIPKKPILDCIFPSGVEWYFCPACNHNGIEKISCYCHKCGQAISWEGDE